MFHGGLFGIQKADDEDNEPGLGSAFRLAGQIIADPLGTATEVDEEVTGSRRTDPSDRSTDRREQRREFRQIEQQVSSSADPTDPPQPDRSDDRSRNKGLIRSIADVTGATEFAESEQAEQLRREREQARREGGIMGTLKSFDAATKAGFDFLLDNPKASVQDTAREGIKAATGVESEDQGVAAVELGQEFNEATRNLTRDTPLDNPVTDAVSTGFEWLIAEPAKAGLTATTGIDVDEGSAEGTVSAIDAFDVGVTVGTFGLGKAGLGATRAAARSSDEAGGLVARVLSRGGDETARVTDEATRAVEDAARAGDNLPVLADEAARTTDNLPVLADEAARAGEDVFGTAPWMARGSARAGEARGFLSRIGARLSDEAARLTDDAARGSDEAARLSDEAARVTDEAAQVADESGGLLSRISGSRAVTFGVATGGVVAGGALLDALGTFDRVEVTDDQDNEYLLLNEKRYQPTSNHPEGGVLWRVDQTGGSSLGYTVMVGVQGRNVYILDQNGNRMRAKVSAEQFNEAIQRARGAS